MPGEVIQHLEFDIDLVVLKRGLQPLRRGFLTRPLRVQTRGRPLRRPYGAGGRFRPHGFLFVVRNQAVQPALQEAVIVAADARIVHEFPRGRPRLRGGPGRRLGGLPHRLVRRGMPGPLGGFEVLLEFQDRLFRGLCLFIYRRREIPKQDVQLVIRNVSVAHLQTLLYFTGSGFPSRFFSFTSERFTRFAPTFTRYFTFGSKS